MKLPKEFEPNLKKAEKLFPLVLELISNFDEAFDNSNQNKLNEIVHQINQLTENKINKEDLYEYWGYTSKENLAFSLSLPNPIEKNSISIQEIMEIKKRIKLLEEYNEDVEKKISKYLFDNKVNIAYVLIEHHYSPLLELYDSDTNVIYL